MKCKGIREKLSLYIDGLLSGPDKERFEDHIARCTECRQLLTETREAVKSVKQAGPVPLPTDFMVRLNERLDTEVARQENRKSIFTLFPWRIAAAAFSVAIVVIVAKETMRPPSQMLMQPSAGANISVPSQQMQDSRENIVESHLKKESKQDIAAAVPLKKERSMPPPASAALVYERNMAEELSTEKGSFDVPPVPATSSRRDATLSSFADSQEARYDAAPYEPDIERGTAEVLRKAAAPSMAAASKAKAQSYDNSTAPVAATGSGSPSIGIKRQWKGSWSGITYPLQTVEATQAGWQSLWKRHEGSPVPYIDFNRNIAVALFMGEQRSAGYSVQITRVEKIHDRVVVWYREISPSRDAAAATALTQPYHIVVIERVGGPIGFHREQ